MLLYKGANWKKLLIEDWLISMACQVACHLAKSIEMLIKIVMIRILYLLTNIQIKLIVGILELLKIIIASFVNW